MTDSNYVKDGTILDDTPSSAAVAGEITQREDGRAEVRVASVDANVLGAVYVEGLFRATCGTSVTFNKGVPLFWDASANTVVTEANANGDADFYIGLAQKAKVSGELYAEFTLNTPRQPGAIGVLMSRVIEFDCETGQSNPDTVLIPADWNKNGIIIFGVYGLVTEVFAGSTEDQGIVTVSDESDNALSTLTASNAAADAVNDVIAGTNPVLGASTGAAVKTVAAGEYVDAAVTQATSGGTPAGKMQVCVLFAPLPH